VGTVARDNIPAKAAAEPVTSSTYMDRASFKIKFPNKDVSCPRINSMKLGVNKERLGCMEISCFHCSGVFLTGLAMVVLLS
jgi:hypothetical protein